MTLVRPGNAAAARGFGLGVAAGILCAALPVQAGAQERVSGGSVVQDLAYGEVLFYFYQEDYFTALTRLLAAKSRDELPSHAAEAELLLGGLYLSYGQHRLAGEIFERLLAKESRPQLHDRAWFFLAKIWQQRGYLSEAEAALDRIGGELPRELEPERRLLHAQVLMDQARFDEARVLLESWQEPEDEWLGYAKYNLGVAFVRLGRIDEGTAILEEVGRLEFDRDRDAPNEELDALRDKANVALGYAWLQAERPEQAKPSLQRVRLSGPFSNKALLGVGWSDAELDNYRGALAPWLELRNRSLLDSAVQESLLAVPYAFAQLGADKQAADHYVDAIAAFDDEISRVDRSIETIRDGRLVEQLLAQPGQAAAGWYWQLDRIPDTAESRYLYELLSTHRFQEALKSYRDLIFLIRNLDRWALSMTAFDDILDTRQRAYDQRLPLIDASLERLDLERMANERLGLESRLSAIERTHDVVALGTAGEQTLWRELEALEPDLQRLGNGDASAQLRAKQRFLKGLLMWDLERDYKARLWAEKKSLRRLDLDLKEARRRRHSVTEARDGWPDNFAAMSARIESLEPRLQDIREAARTALARQHDFLQAIAVEELDGQRQRLNTYRVQARFSLAAIYDRAAANVESDSGSGIAADAPAPADAWADSRTDSRVDSGGSSRADSGIRADSGVNARVYARADAAGSAAESSEGRR